MAQSVTATGNIDVPPENRAVLSAYSSGYVKDAPFLVGDKVRRGEVLATLEAPEFIRLQRQYLEIAGSMDYLKAEYQRQQVLLDEQISSRKNFLRAESNYKSALATYNGLRKELDLLHIDRKAVASGKLTSSIPILAPIAGTISMVSISKGMYVTPSDRLMEIVNNDHIHLELSVYEKDILKVHKGQGIVFKIPEASGQKYTGEVHLVGTSLDPLSRTIKVHGHLDEGAPTNLAIGMFVEAKIVTGKQLAQVLPDEAIVKSESKNFVCLLKEETDEQMIFQKIEVKIGRSEGGLNAIEDIGELPADARFLIRGAYSVM